MGIFHMLKLLLTQLLCRECIVVEDCYCRERVCLFIEYKLRLAYSCTLILCSNTLTICACWLERTAKQNRHVRYQPCINVLSVTSVAGLQ